MKSQILVFEQYSYGNWHLRSQGTFENDYPFPKVVHVSSLESISPNIPRLCKNVHICKWLATTNAYVQAVINMKLGRACTVGRFQSSEFTEYEGIKANVTAKHFIQQCKLNKAI